MNCARQARARIAVRFCFLGPSVTGTESGMSPPRGMGRAESAESPGAETATSHPFDFDDATTGPSPQVAETTYLVHFQPTFALHHVESRSSRSFDPASGLASIAE